MIIVYGSVQEFLTHSDLITDLIVLNLIKHGQFLNSNAITELLENVLSLPLPNQYLFEIFCHHWFCVSPAVRTESGMCSYFSFPALG